MHDLTGFQRDLLYVIAGLKNPQGLAVKEELDDYYGNEINHGQLYLDVDGHRWSVLLYGCTINVRVERGLSAMDLLPGIDSDQFPAFWPAWGRLP